MTVSPSGDAAAADPAADYDRFKSKLRKDVEGRWRWLEALNQMPEEERQAGELLADILGGSWSDIKPRDLPGDGKRVHDELLCCPEK